MKNLNTTKFMTLAVLPLVTLLAVGCANHDTDKANKVSSTPTAPGVPTLTKQIQSETGLTVLVDSSATPEAKATLEFTMTEFLKMVRERHPELRSFGSVFFSDSKIPTWNSVIREHPGNNGQAFLVVELNRTPEAVRQSLRYYQDRTDDLVIKNKELKDEIKRGMQIDVQVDGAADAVTTNWALNQIKTIALGSLEVQKTFRAINTIRLSDSYSVTAATIGKENTIATIDARSMDAATIKEFFTTQASEMLQRFDFANQRLQRLGIRQGFKVRAVMGTPEEVETVATELEKEAARPDHGLARLHEVSVWPLANQIQVFPEGFFKKGYSADLSAWNEKALSELRATLQRLRSDAKIDCKVPRTICY